VSQVLSLGELRRRRIFSRSDARTKVQDDQECKGSRPGVCVCPYLNLEMYVLAYGSELVLF
jgi:hypothetical protein